MQWNFLFLLFRNYINISYSCGILRKRTSLAVAWYLFLDSSFWSKVCLSATHRRLCYLSNGPANSVTIRYFKKGYLDMLLKICGWGKNEIIQFTFFPLLNLISEKPASRTYRRGIEVNHNAGWGNGGRANSKLQSIHFRARERDFCLLHCLKRCCRMPCIPIKPTG